MSSKIMLALVALSCLVGLGLAGGKKDYEEECSIGAQILNVFKSDENDDPNACNTDKGLVCLGGKCMCTPPATVYEKGFLGGIFGGGRCVGAANSPCVGKDSVCVANAECGDGTISLCKCKDGYHYREGHCTNGSNKAAALNGLYAFGLILSYFVFTQ